MKNKSLFKLVSIFAFLLLLPSFLKAETPLGAVSEIYKLLSKYSNNNKQTDSEKNKINSFFLIDKMSKEIIEDHWDSMSAQQQKKYLALMKQLLEKTIYEDTGKNLQKGKFTIQESRFVTKKKAVVLTSILIIKTNLKIQNNFGLEYQKNHQWKVSSIEIDGADLAQDYKSQFSTIISKHGFDKTSDSLFPRISKAIEAKDKDNWTHLSDNDSDNSSSTDKNKNPKKNETPKTRPTLLEG